MGACVSVATLVEKLGLSAWVWRRLGDEGKVRVVRVGGRRWFDFDSCRLFLERGEPVEAAPALDWAKVGREFRERVRGGEI